MPIFERDPWRLQYFEKVDCPPHVRVPTDDIDSHAWFPEHRWIYDKLKVARSQELASGMSGEPPPAFPVFAKPNVNLRGMGLESRIIRTQREFESLSAGHMWMPVMQGEHISTDCAVVNGEVKWMRHALGLPWHEGMFTHWVIESGQRPELNQFLSAWVQRSMAGYTGMMNFETIGGAIIEAHLRFADQWCDLYGRDWFDALVGLYAGEGWAFGDDAPRTGYSVPLFATHGTVPPHPSPAQQAAIRAMPDVSSLQITYYASKAGNAHPMPPGGFRLGLVNCWDLESGKKARRALAQCFPGVEVMLPED